MSCIAYTRSSDPRLQKQLLLVGFCEANELFPHSLNSSAKTFISSSQRYEHLPSPEIYIQHMRAGSRMCLRRPCA